MARIMGLDVGDRKIGVAISDEMGWTAQPVTVVQRQNAEQALAELVGLAREYEVGRVVVGLPRNMDGSLGPQAEKTKTFAEKLGNELRIEIDYWDERLSTKAAHRALLEADLSRAKRKKVVDKVAAVLILQGFLDLQSSRGGA